MVELLRDAYSFEHRYERDWLKNWKIAFSQAEMKERIKLDIKNSDHTYYGDTFLLGISYFLCYRIVFLLYKIIQGMRTLRQEDIAVKATALWHESLLPQILFQQMLREMVLSFQNLQ